MKVFVYIVFSLFVFFSCKKKETPATPTSNTTGTSTGNPIGGPLTQTSTQYVRFTLNNTVQSFFPPQSGLAGYMNPPQVYTDFNTNKRYCISSFRRYANGNTAVPFDLKYIDTITNSITDSYFRNYVAVKNIRYSNGQTNFSFVTDLGVILTTTLNGVSWSTFKSQGVSFQSGSTFSITEVFEFSLPGSPNLNRMFKANFNCKLYNNLGDSAFATNGELILEMKK
jgi:hypothetical protein